MLNETIAGGWKECFEVLLHSTNKNSMEEAETERWDPSSLRVRSHGLPQQRWMRCARFLQTLDDVGLSWLTCFCNIAWTSGKVPLEWQTQVVVPLCRFGGLRISSMLCAEDVVLLVSLNSGLQLTLRRFAAECGGGDEDQHL